MLDFTKWENVLRVRQIEKTLDLYNKNEWVISQLFGAPQVEKVQEMESMLGPKLTECDSHNSRLFYYFGVGGCEDNVPYGLIKWSCSEERVQLTLQSCEGEMKYINSSSDTGKRMDTQEMRSKLNSGQLEVGDTIVWTASPLGE